MSDILYRGYVVETRQGMLVFCGVSGAEVTLAVREHDAQPGDYVWVYGDGQVEVQNRYALPANVKEMTLPSTLDGQDHS